MDQSMRSEGGEGIPVAPAPPPLPGKAGQAPPGVGPGPPRGTGNIPQLKMAAMGKTPVPHGPASGTGTPTMGASGRGLLPGRLDGKGGAFTPTGGTPVGNLSLSLARSSGHTRRQ